MLRSPGAVATGGQPPKVFEQPPWPRQLSFGQGKRARRSRSRPLPVPRTVTDGDTQSDRFLQALPDLQHRLPVTAVTATTASAALHRPRLVGQNCACSTGNSVPRIASRCHPPPGRRPRTSVGTNAVHSHIRRPRQSIIPASEPRFIPCLRGQNLGRRRFWRACRDCPRVGLGRNDAWGGHK